MPIIESQPLPDKKEGMTYLRKLLQNLGIRTVGTSLTNVSIGGQDRQYIISDGGIYSFGDGSDGAGVADGSTALAGASLAANVYTLTRDVYYTDLTVSAGVTIKPSGYRIFGTGALTNFGTAQRDGNAAVGGLGGAALADGYLKGSLAGGAGGAGSLGGTNPGIAGGNTSNSIGSNGSAGGNGGSGGAGGAGGTATASNVRLIANWHLATLLDISSSGASVKFDNSAAAGGGGTSGFSAGFSCGGGGAGSAGGIVAIYFRKIINKSTGLISANGGAGAAGVACTNNFGSGGGAGGNGGQIILVYNELENLGSITATAGLGGAGGAGGAAGTAGANGTAGTIRQFQISL